VVSVAGLSLLQVTYISQGNLRTSYKLCNQKYAQSQFYITSKKAMATTRKACISSWLLY